MHRDGGAAKRIFCCPHGVWAGLCGVRETCNGPGTRTPCHLVTSLLPRPLAPEVPGFVLFARMSAQERSPPCVARHPHPGSYPSLQVSPGYRGQHPSWLLPPSSTESCTPGLACAVTSSRIYKAPFWKGGSGRCKGRKTWKEMAQCLLPSQGLCPGPGFWMSELLVAS